MEHADCNALANMVLHSGAVAFIVPDTVAPSGIFFPRVRFFISLAVVSLPI